MCRYQFNTTIDIAAKKRHKETCIEINMKFEVMCLTHLAGFAKEDLFSLSQKKAQSKLFLQIKSRKWVKIKFITNYRPNCRGKAEHNNRDAENQERHLRKIYKSIIKERYGIIYYHYYVFILLQIAFKWVSLKL